jgi:P4 family phage/plasmid primase-like protien
MVEPKDGSDAFPPLGANNRSHHPDPGFLKGQRGKWTFKRAGRYYKISGNLTTGNWRLMVEAVSGTEKPAAMRVDLASQKSRQLFARSAASTKSTQAAIVDDLQVAFVEVKRQAENLQEIRDARHLLAVRLGIDKGLVEGDPDTDTRNAFRLVERVHGYAHYVAEWRDWIVWDGKRWVRDSLLQVMEFAKETAREIYHDAAAEKRKEDGEKLAKWAKTSNEKKRLEAMIALARSDSRIVMSVAQLDCDPWLLNAQNGTIDLKTGRLREHGCDDLITKLAPVKYDSSGKCRRWKRFLLEIMGGNRNLVRFLRRAVGYCLTGDAKERVLFVLHGLGRNGKSVFLMVIRKLLGDYALKIKARTLLIKRNESDSYEVADLKGIRFAYASESTEGERLDEALIKELTGGEEISARNPYEKNFRFFPEFKLWLGTNHKPEIRGTDKAIWDRVRLVPFRVRFGTPDRPENKKLLEELLEELPGILNWALQGCLEWKQIGLGESQEVETATESYREEMDSLADFIESECVLSDGIQVNATALYGSYINWAKKNQEEPLKRKAFASRMEGRGFTKKKSSLSFWVGIGLSSHGSLESKEAKDGSVGVNGSDLQDFISSHARWEKLPKNTPSDSHPPIPGSFEPRSHGGEPSGGTETGWKEGIV